MNLKDNYEINEGKGGQREHPKQNKLQVQTPRGESRRHFTYLRKAGQKGGQEEADERRVGASLGSKLEPDYAGPCRQQEATGSQKSVIGESSLQLQVQNRLEWGRMAVGSRSLGERASETRQQHHNGRKRKHTHLYSRGWWKTGG